ncbi:hypothetical protein ACFE04_031930 [Oxalis oulophora]
MERRKDRWGAKYLTELVLVWSAKPMTLLLSNAAQNPVQSSLDSLPQCPPKPATYNHVKSSIPAVQECSEKAVTLVVQTPDEKPVQQLSSPIRKKVTFDSIVKTYEHVLPNESTDFTPENQENYKKENDTSLQKSGNSRSSGDDSSVTSSGSYPANHRYQNCRDSDDELDFEESDVEDEYDDDGDLDSDDLDEVCDDDKILESKTWDCDSVQGETGFTGIGRDRNVHSVLNPVENLTQWKVAKAKGTQQLNQQKENFNSEPRNSFTSESSFFKEMSFCANSEFEHQPKKSPNREISVDASLSNWLSSTESTPSITKTSKFSYNATTPDRSISHSSFSPRSFDDRPILGALTVEELKQHSVTSSPRKSPCRSPDEMPLIGTVGTYWNHAGSAKDSGSATSFKGIPNTTSKYREDKRVNWHSTPFETRLERALNAKACSANAFNNIA